MKKKMTSIGIFGGAFDPVHQGHLNSAKRVQAQFQFDHFFFLPCKTPLLKNQTQASPEHRLAMLRLALANFPDFNLDTREIDRSSPSFMVDTLNSYRKEYPNAALCLVLGYDAFLKLPEWHQWEDITDLSHIVVIDRLEHAQETMPKECVDFLNSHQTSNPKALVNTTHGLVYRFNAGNYPVSSTKIRRIIKNKDNSDIQVPEEVYLYIREHGLYL